MELIGKQIAIETILGQPPELHYPSWYAAQIEKLPPAPPEYLAEQAGILDTDADTISRQAAISAICSACGKIDCDKMDKCEKLQLPPANCSEFPNSSDTISRAKAIDALTEYGNGRAVYIAVEEVVRRIEQLPPAQPEIIHCRDCKYFELDHFEKVDEFPIPIIVAHEICMKWGEGCKSSVDGWCFMAERRTDETD